MTQAGIKLVASAWKPLLYMFRTASPQPNKLYLELNKSVSQMFQLRSHCVRRLSQPQHVHVRLCLHSSQLAHHLSSYESICMLLFSQRRACGNRTLISDGFTMSDTSKPPLAVTQWFLNSTAAASFLRGFSSPSSPSQAWAQSLFSWRIYHRG